MIRNTQTSMKVDDARWEKIFGKKNRQVSIIVDNQLQGDSDESTLTLTQEAKDRARWTMLLKDVGDVK